MEINKDEAIKSISIAEKKISENDYVGAKKFVNKAQNLYPKLDGLKQVSMMIDVYISASDKIKRKGEADWYGVLSVDPLVKDEDLKRQYKKLALLLHPDKNKFTGATEAFKLISEAWCVLSDKAQRFAYDLKRKSTDVESGMYQKEPKRHKPDFSWNKPKYEYQYESESDPESDPESEPEPDPESEPEPFGQSVIDATHIVSLGLIVLILTGPCLVQIADRILLQPR